MSEERIERLEQRVDLLFRQVNANAAAIAAKPDTSEMRAGFNEVVQWLSTQEVKIDRLQADVSGINQRLDEQSANIQRILDLLRREDN